MNVLLLGNEGDNTVSLKVEGLCTILRQCLPSYDVRYLSKIALESEPWDSTTALVITYGILLRLSEEAQVKIEHYVRKGGAFLSLCSSQVAILERTRGQGCTGEESIREERMNTSGSGITPIGLDELRDDISTGLEMKIFGSPMFVYSIPRQRESIRILAQLSSSQHEILAKPTVEGVVAFLGHYGRGRALFWGCDPMNDAANSSSEVRIVMLGRVLRMLDLEIAACPETGPTCTPIYLCGPPVSLQRLRSTLISLCASDNVLVEANDTFKIETPDDKSDAFFKSPFERLTLADERPADTFQRLCICEDIVPAADMSMPSFDIHLFQKLLSKAKAHLGYPASPVGNVIGYAETITSTQTILDKNFRLLQSIPDGTVLTASRQLNGRGRGSNSWLSPPGSLPHSVVVHLQQQCSSRMVFVQYLYGLAVVEAIRSGLAGRLTSNSLQIDISQVKAWASLDIRLKWPNDIYALDPKAEAAGKTGLNRYSKIGGILVNSHFSKDHFINVIGCGVNVSTLGSLLSLHSLIEAHNRHIAKISTAPLPQISHEALLVAILATFASMWKRFSDPDRDGFDSFQSMYTDRWLHSNQLISISEEVECAARHTLSPASSKNPRGDTHAKIVGLTKDHGFLRARCVTLDQNGREVLRPYNELPQEVELQPDGNSFDMLKGLLKRKT